MMPRYPVYVPSRDRWQDGRALTVKALHRDEVPFRLVVTPSQAADYASWVTDRDELLILPDDDHGLLETRNWIRRHAEASGVTRHWQLDDNLRLFHRLWENERIPVHAGVSLRVCEDFTDRFENVGISGLDYGMFARDGRRTPPPFRRNGRVYSCTLVNHEMPFRWRLRRNDDTDLCLQALTNGWATILLVAFTAKKIVTMTVKGGNTDALYRDEPESEERDTLGRYEMAEDLVRAWPGVVTVARRFGRYQHSVNWRGFADVPLVLRPGVDLEALPEVDEYGLVLRPVETIRSRQIRELLARYEDTLARTVAADPLWRGMPGFHRFSAPPALEVLCRTDADRGALVDRLDLGTATARFDTRSWSSWWPPRDRGDPSSLRFDTEARAA